MIETMRGDKKKCKWTNRENKIFYTLKEKVTILLVLSLSNFNKVFQVDCDTSGDVIGIVLSQEGKPTIFFNENFSGDKRKY